MPAPAVANSQPPVAHVAKKDQKTEAKPAELSHAEAKVASAEQKPTLPPTAKTAHTDPSVAVPVTQPAAAKSNGKAPSKVPEPSNKTDSIDDATAAATAAVAAAMANLPGPAVQSSSMGNLTRKIGEMRAGPGNNTRTPRQPGGPGFAARGRGRGGARTESRKIEVPDTDYDFETANAKFDKSGSAKTTATATPQGADSASAGSEQPAPAVAAYNKQSSFFDDLSSDQKSRSEKQGGRPGGREWRLEENKRNIEAFGAGSVDGVEPRKSRGGYRGRGGRGREGRERREGSSAR
jgi:protein LSM14